MRAEDLKPGDRLVGHDKVVSVVIEVIKMDQVQKVYNVRVADDHTYFVGHRTWGFSVWVHNAYSYEEVNPGKWQVFKDGKKAVHGLTFFEKQKAIDATDTLNAALDKPAASQSVTWAAYKCKHVPK